MTIKARGYIVMVEREVSPTSVGGVLLPDSAKKPVHKGKVLSVGKLVSDPDIKTGSIAVFNKSAGFEIEEDGITYLVLNQADIVGGD